MARKLKNFEDETHKMFHLEYGEKYSKTWKMRNAHYRTWSMSRKLQIMEYKEHKIQDLDYREKTEKPRKRDRNSGKHVLWREN